MPSDTASGSDCSDFRSNVAAIEQNDSKQGEKSSKDIIPQKLHEYLKGNLPDYSLPRLDDYWPQWKEYSPGVTTPFVCIGDFNGDGRLDCAMILLNKSKMPILFGFHRTPDGYRHFVIDSFAVSDKIGLILSVKQKGRWEILDETITVNNAGIRVQMMEESLTRAYYWDGKKYVRVLFD